MGKYSSKSRRVEKPKRGDGTHVIWRGIGCVMMIIIPAISIAAGYETINYGLDNDWTIPYQLLGTARLPDIFYESTGLWAVFGFMTRIPHFYAYAATSFLYMVLIGGVCSVTYAFVYRLIGPPQYGPLDAPPPKIKTKKYTR